MHEADLDKEPPLKPGGHQSDYLTGYVGAAAAMGAPEEIERAFREAFVTLDRRISLFLCLPLASLDKLAMKKEIDTIGRQ